MKFIHTEQGGNRIFFYFLFSCLIMLPISSNFYQFISFHCTAFAYLKIIRSCLINYMLVLTCLDIYLGFSCFSQF